MGQCGCADTVPDFRFPGPDGIHYGIQIYPSCDNCSTPAGVILYRLDDESAEEWLDGVDPAPFAAYSDGGVNSDMMIPVVGAEELAAQIVLEKREDADYNGDPDDYREISEEDIRFALPEAVRQTFCQWRGMDATHDTEETNHG